MKKRKPLLSAVMIFALLICMFPVTAYAAADGSTSTWVDLVEEFDSIKTDGGTITLSTDIEKTTDTEEAFSATNGVTIDTNGHSIIIEAGTVTFGENVMIIGSTDGVAPLKIAGGGEDATAEVLLAGAAVRKIIPAVGAAVEVDQYAVLRTTTNSTCIEGINLALDVKSGGQVYHEYGSILAANSGIGTATAVHVEAGGFLQIVSAGVTATSDSPTGVLVDGFLNVSGSASISTSGNGGSGILIQSTGEATVDNGGVVAGSGVETAGVRVVGGELTLRGGTVYGVTYGISAIDNSQVLVTGTAVAGQRGTTVNISQTGAYIEGENASFTVEDGTVKGLLTGIHAQTRCSIDLIGGDVQGTTDSGCGLYLYQNARATINGATVQGGANASGCGLDILPFTTATVSQSEGKTTIITGGKGAMVSGQLLLNGGTVTGESTYGAEIGEGGKLIMHDGSISGSGTGIITTQIGDGAEIWGGTVTGTEYGINNNGSLSMMGGSVQGADALSLGSTSQTLLYHGSAAGQGPDGKAIYVEGDPELCIYSGFVGGDSIYIEEGHRNYFTRQSLTMSRLPDSITLTLGDNIAITMMPDGQALDGAIMFLEDILGGGPVTLRSAGNEIASFTVSGNEFAFTPIGVGTASLVIEDTVTYNGVKTINVTVRADTTTTYTVTFNSNSSVYATKTVSAGESIDNSVWPDDPTRSNYTFGGWFTGENGTGSQFTSATSVNEIKTVYAKWTYNGGGGGNSGGGGGGGTPSTPTYKAEVKAGDGTETTLPVTIDKNKGTASIDIGSQSLTKSGTVITIPSVQDVDTYSVGSPVQYLSMANGQETLTLNTESGSITIPSNMLTGVAGISGSKAQIIIGQGDKSNLPQDIRDAIGNRPLIQITLSIDGRQTNWNNLDAPVKVSLPYKPTANELAHPESIVVWYIDGSGNVITIPNGHYDPSTGMVTFEITHFSDYAVVYHSVSFNDVAASAWYCDAVDFIAARDITLGMGNGKYSPGSKLTRGEFLVLMMRAYNITPDTYQAENFADAGNAYYTGYLAAAKRLGISSGIGNNMYAPAKEITRQEMFALLNNTLKVIGQPPEGNSGKKLSDFTDAELIEPWAKEAMTLLVKTGAIGGNAGKLNPTNTTTRAEMAQVLYNLLLK